MTRSIAWLSVEEIARDALVNHMITTGSFLNRGGRACMCGQHVAHNPTERQNHKADVIVEALRRAGRLLE